MDSLPKILDRSLDLILTPAGIWQLALIVISLAIAWVVHKRWQGFIRTYLGEQERRGIKRFALRSSGRLLFPLLLAILFAAERGLLQQFGLKTFILDILIPLFVSLAIIRVSLYSLRRAYGPSTTLRAFEGLITTVVWVAVGLHLLGWLDDVLMGMDAVGFKLGEARLSVLSVSQFILIAAIFIVAASWTTRWIEQRARRSNLLSPTMQVGLAKFSKVILYTVAILIALNSVGIDLTTLTVFGGALGVGLGFGLQRIASNFISGFILLFDRSIRPGDVITVGQRFGWVVALHARYVVVRDRDGVETLIPNENLITSEVTNWSYSDRHVRVKIPVQISYSDDPNVAMDLLIGACQANKRVLTKPEPQARLLGFGDNGIDLELRIWLQDPEQGVGSVVSDVNLAIWNAFKENNITIPYPQRDVRLIK